MKKRLWIPILAVLALLALLLVPIPKGACDDGGTREYVALTYKIVDWHRLTLDGVYEKTRVYFGADRYKSIDELMKQEYAQMEQKMIARVLEISGTSVLVAPVPGEEALRSSDKISFSISELRDIGAEVGSLVEVTYTGGIMETYPAQIRATGWKLSAP